jgi:hypothetical protein
MATFFSTFLLTTSTIKYLVLSVSNMPPDFDVPRAHGLEGSCHSLNPRSSHVLVKGEMEPIWAVLDFRQYDEGQVAPYLHWGNGKSIGGWARPSWVRKGQMLSTLRYPSWTLRGRARFVLPASYAVPVTAQPVIEIPQRRPCQPQATAFPSPHRRGRF